MPHIAMPWAHVALFYYAPYCFAPHSCAAGDVSAFLCEIRKIPSSCPLHIVFKVFTDFEKINLDEAMVSFLLCLSFCLLQTESQKLYERSL